MRYLFKSLLRSTLGPALLPILLLVLLGTAVYARLEGWTPLEALYATIITITTVGYGDFSPQTPAGRLFAILFTLTAIGLAGYAISTLAAVIIDFETGHVKRKIMERRMKRITDLHDHIIICGATIVGHRVANEFKQRGTPFVLVEADAETLRWALLWLNERYFNKRMRSYKKLEEIDFAEEESLGIDELAFESGILYLHEDPTEEQQLLRAGIVRAAGLVAAMDDDRDNLAIVLSARDMATRLDNPRLHIVARVSNEWNMHRMYLAGADKVISPNFSGAFRMATELLSPELGAFMDHMIYKDDQTMRFNDMRLADYPDLAGLSVADLKRQQSQLVVAIRRNGSYHYAPDGDTRFEPDDVLIVMGPAGQ